MRLNDPLTGHFAAYLPIAPTEIEQLEIVRGAGAALYGPDAVGGVINIVTKTFAATHRPDEAEAQATYLSGEWQLRSLNAGAYGQHKGLRLAGGVLSNSTIGQPRPAPSTLRGDARLQTYSLSAAYQLTPRLNVAARASFDQRDFNAQYFYTTSPADQAREATTRDWYQGQARYEHADGSRTEAQVAASRSTDRYAFTPTSVASEHLMHYTNAQLSHHREVTSWLRGTVGGQADRRAIVSNDRGDHATWHVAAYALALATPRPGLALTGGLRLDHDRAYGNELVPQLNVSQNVGQAFLVRGSVSRAIRAADFTERYTSNSRPGVVPTGFNVGKADLAAERTLNYEAGVDYQPRPGLLAKATYFRREGRNLIDYVPTPGAQVLEATGLPNLNPAATYRFAQNLFAVTTQGLETELSAAHEFTPRLRLDGRVGYTYVHVDNRQGLASQYLANVARHLVAGTLALSIPRANLSLGGLWKKRDGAATAAISRTLGSEYLVFNARLEVALLPGRVWALAQVQNLTDARYADLLGAQMPRRWWMGGLRVAVGR